MTDFLRARLMENGSSGGGGGGGPINEIHVEGLNFISNGIITKHRCITAFTLWQLACNGEWGQAGDYIDWAVSKGFTDFRLFGCWGNTNFNPRNIPNAYAILEELEILVNGRGGRLMMTAFTDQVDGSPVLMNSNEQHDHFGMIATVMARRKTGKLEVCNEYRKNWKPPYPLPFTRPDFKGVTGVISTWYDEEPPEQMGNNIDFVTKHTGGFDEEWSRKSKVCVEAQKGQGGGLGGYPPAFKPCMVGERCRIAEGSFPHEHESSTAIEEAMGAGGCVHGGFNPGQNDSLLQRCIIPTNPAAVDCIDAAVSVFDKIASDVAANWGYGNSGGGIILHDDNLMLRTYVMQDGNKAYVIRVQGHKPGMGITTINDWKVINKFGRNETVLYCER
jgi:hypothetical protein